MIYLTLEKTCNCLGGNNVHAHCIARFADGILKRENQYARGRF